ncbi:C6 transcription factor [Aspergillus nomiae NRRL 13137]|uniref:C6 transcription factor n=1 Tax=Aspergillus nomiae NRRL (strain ATCC 15546 / NRRL 13137 / CBS 260.88 / M93) TaxID=1509407 RepID=A0A0L1JBQ8_ASPN3|nr:C6 transcription factor [Aspergillus nomiae NRRL 13137]KNG89152.1 C6 transcription factor [Aspergillus nomiae NRRL 13137]
MESENTSDHTYEEPRVLRRYNVSRSCIRCHQRKVRCDKSHPCTTCARSNVTCRYPGSEKTKRRAPNVGLNEVAARLARLERAVSAIVGADEGITVPSSSGSGPASTDRTAVDQQVRDPYAAREGFLVTSGPSARYINESFLSHVLEKEKELQTVIESPLSASGGSTVFSPLRAEGLLLNPQHAISDVAELYPSRWEATQLWQVYLNNVNPLMRVVHIPTLLPKVYNAINAPSDVPADLSALLFAIYFAATTSLLSINEGDFLGGQKHAALQKYQRGLEVSLYNSSFLDSPTMTSLQAMAIYVRCRRFHSSGRSNWVLNGLTIYAAQSIGLHRDGSNFRLPILECELRRRLWWHIITADRRVAEDHGLVGGSETISNTNLPLNVDDSDLSPQMKTPPSPKETWTEMTMFLITAEASKVFARIHRVSLQSQRGRDVHNESRKLVADLDARLSKTYLKYCDQNVPVQKATFLLGRLLLSKARVLVHIQSLNDLSAEQSAKHINEETLSYACEGLECGSEMLTDEVLKSYSWLSSTYTPYHLLTYALWHLCLCPETPGVERAWSAVNTCFELTERDAGWRESNPHWAVLCRLRQKALSIRRSCLGAKPGEGLSDLGLMDLPDTGPQIDFGDSPMPWDLDPLAFFDWTSFAPTF